MKKVLFLVLVTMLTSMTPALGQGLTAFFSYAMFNRTAETPYVETYLSFDAWNLKFVQQDDGTYRASVQITLLVTQADTTVLVRKYDLQSPAIAAADENRFNFIDMQRFALNNGRYQLTMRMKDMHTEAAPVEVNESLVVDFNAKRPTISSIIPVSKSTPTTTPNILSRNGYDMEPYISDYYPEQIKTLNFYYEIYNIQDEVGDNDFMTLCYLERKETGARVESTLQGRRQSPSAAEIGVYGSVDLTSIPSGNYNLVVEVRNSRNELILFRKLPFSRSNPSITENVSPATASFAAQIQEENTMNYYLSALYPICLERERVESEYLASLPGNMSAKQEFFYNFWLSRNPLNPEAAWKEYKIRLDYVAANFSRLKTPGYLTDRGRVYLQYGPPDFIRDEKNFVSSRYLGNGTNKQTEFLNNMGNISAMTETLTPQASNSQGQIFYLPYQLWRYNQLPGQDINRVFLFWDEFRSGSYKLLNSNANGEVRDPKWERRLSQQQLNEDVRGEVGEQFERGY